MCNVICDLFRLFQLFQILPMSTNLKEAYTSGRDDQQNFIQNLGLFLCSFLKEHGSLLEEKVELLSLFYY